MRSEEVSAFRISWEGGVGRVGSDIGWDVEFTSLMCIGSGAGGCLWNLGDCVGVPEAEFWDDMRDLDAGHVGGVEWVGFDGVGWCC